MFLVEMPSFACSNCVILILGLYEMHLWEPDLFSRIFARKRNFPYPEHYFSFSSTFISENKTDQARISTYLWNIIWKPSAKTAVVTLKCTHAIRQSEWEHTDLFEDGFERIIARVRHLPVVVTTPVFQALVHDLKTATYRHSNKSNKLENDHINRDYRGSWLWCLKNKLKLPCNHRQCMAWTARRDVSRAPEHCEAFHSAPSAPKDRSPFWHTCRCRTSALHLQQKWAIITYVVTCWRNEIRFTEQYQESSEWHI